MSKTTATRTRRTPRLKPLPVLHSDEEAEHFVDTADLSEYDLSGFVPARSVLHFTQEDTPVSLQLPPDELDRIKQTAARKGVSYQSYIREVLAKAVAEDEKAENR
jgi:predicted DNA binding CopG/RHH family protein